MLESKKIWFDEQLVDYDEAKIHVLTHGLHYGTGIFEGIRFYNTDNGPAIFRLDDHIRRLFDSGKAYFMHFGYTRDDIKQFSIDTVRANDLSECYIRIIAFYGYGKLGVNPLPNKVSVAIAVWNWSEHIKKEDREQGINAMVSSWMKVDVKFMPNTCKGCFKLCQFCFSQNGGLKIGF